MGRAQARSAPRAAFPVLCGAVAAFALVALTSVCVAVGAELPLAPAVTESSFHVQFVDVVWFPFEESAYTGEAQDSDAAASERGADTRESRPQTKEFDVAVIEVFFDQPVFVNHSLSLYDAQRFLRLHRHHRMILYGLIMLECKARHAGEDTIVVHSFPAGRAPLPPGGVDSPGMIFPLPSSTDSEFRWLNAVSGEYAFEQDRIGYQAMNHVAFAMLLSARQGDHEPVVYFDEARLASCDLVFPREDEQGWVQAVSLTGAAPDSLPVVGRYKLEASRAPPKHLHIVEHGGKGEKPFEAPQSFLETKVTAKTGIPFLQILLSPITDGIAGPAVLGATDYINVALENELFAKLAGYVSGTTTPGAMDPLGPPIYLEEQVNVTHTQRNLQRALAASHKCPAFASFLQQEERLRERRTPFSALPPRFTELLNGARGTAAATPPKDPIDGCLTYELIVVLIRDLTISLTIALTEELSNHVTDHLTDLIVQQLKEQLAIELARSVPTTTEQATAQTLTQTVSAVLNRALPPMLLPPMADILTHTLTRGLTHSIGSTLTFTMKQTALEEPLCYRCRNGSPEYCPFCRRKAQEEYYNNYYLEYFKAFYSDYYADYMVHGRANTVEFTGSLDDIQVSVGANIDSTH